VHLPQQFSEVVQPLPALVQSIEDLNPTSTGSDTLNNPTRFAAVLISYEQFQVWSKLVSLPMEKFDFLLFYERLPTDEHPLTTTYPENYRDNNCAHFVPKFLEHRCDSTSIGSSYLLHYRLSLFSVPSPPGRSLLIDWDYLLSLRSHIPRVIMYGIQQVRMEPRPSDDYVSLMSLCASAAACMNMILDLTVMISLRILVIVAIELLSHAISVIFIVVSRTRELRHPFFVLSILALLQYASAAGSTDDTNGPRCQVFDGVNISFMPWIIAFSAWIAWKKPELMALVSGASTRPVPAQGTQPSAAESKRLAEWDLLNVQLYGALVSFATSNTVMEGVFAKRTYRVRIDADRVLVKIFDPAHRTMAKSIV